MLYHLPMVALRRLFDNFLIRLPQDALIGRSPDAVLVLTSRRASSSHATIRWTGREWELRDMGSRNGTRLGGQPMAPGSTMLLSLGQVVEFGDATQRFTVEDLSEPIPTACRLGGGGTVLLEEGYITLPSTEEPEVYVFEHPSLGWLIDDGSGDLEPAEHGRIITVAGASWRLHLIEAAGTLALNDVPRSLADATLRLMVSPDEENVDAELVWSDESRILPPSVHWYIALILARARLADQQAGDQPKREQGWVHRDDLCDQLKIAARKLNVDIHRLRLLLAGAGITDGADLFQRRSATAQIRLGIADIELT